MSTPFHDDLLSRKEFSDRLERFLLTEHQFADDALVVSLQAPFGSGKTYFLENWKNSLQQRRTEKQPDTENKTLPRAIMLNAWESDYCGDPLLALISAIIKNLKSDTTKEEKQNIQQIKKALKDMGNFGLEAFKDIGNFGLSLANSTVSSCFGADPLAAKEYAEGAKEKRAQQEHPEINLLEAFENKQRALNKIKEQLKALFGGNDVRAIIMVDELDRCRPDYAISYLETIKHIFDLHGLVFVLAIDHAQLRSAAKALFGADMNFDEYFRKFAKRRIELPEIQEESCEKITNYYFNKYLLSNETRICFFSKDNASLITDMITAIHPNLRQLQEIFRIIGHYFTCNEMKKTSVPSAYGAGVALMATLRVTNEELFRKIGMGTLDFEKEKEVLKNILKIDKNRDEFFWSKLFIFGFSKITHPDGKHKEQYINEFKKFGIIPENANEGLFLQQLDQYSRAWGIPNWNFLEYNFFHTIYGRIEDIKSFAYITR
jgi:hypothetical protein